MAHLTEDVVLTPHERSRIIAGVIAVVLTGVVAFVRGLRGSSPSRMADEERIDYTVSEGPERPTWRKTGGIKGPSS